MSSLYETLLLPTSANSEQIKTNYYLLCRKYHPTRNPYGYDHYLKIQKAYTILSDRHTKDFYDRFGDNWLCLLKEERASFLITHKYDWINLHLITVSVFLFFLNIITLPFLLHLFIKKKIFKSIKYIFSPTFLAMIIVFVVFLRIINMLYKVNKFDVNSEILWCGLFLQIIIVVFIQIFAYFYTLDNSINVKLIVHMVPYLTFEYVVVYYMGIFAYKKILKVNLKRFGLNLVVRVVTIFCIVKYMESIARMYTLIAWIGLVMVMERIHCAIISVICGFLLCLLTGCLNIWLKKIRMWLYLFLVPVYLLIFIIFVSAKVLQKKFKPKSIFMPDRLPIEI